MKYIIVQLEEKPNIQVDDTMIELSAMVNEKIAEGYEPIGGISVRPGSHSGAVYLQAMVYKGDLQPEYNQYHHPGNLYGAWENVSKQVMKHITIKIKTRADKMSKDVTFDRPKLEQLKKAYDAAVENGKEEFTFEDYEYVTNYAKYLIEYVEAHIT